MKYKISNPRFLVNIFYCLILFVPISYPQTRTVGLLQNDSSLSFNGYTLFAPIPSTTTYLINNNGMLVHSWASSYQPGQAVMFLPNGHLLRTATPSGNLPFNAGGAGGIVEIYDWDGNLLWTYQHYGTQYRLHHDVEYLPNGNILLISWEKKTIAEAIAAGRNPSNIQDNELWPEKIIEVQPIGSSGGKIVWEWHIWDHLIQDYDATKPNYGTISQHPQLVDINFGSKEKDWLHINSIRFNSDRNEIMVSVHNLNEVWIIDHSTTTLQAAGHTGGRRGRGGDLLYRWGNPQAYKLGTASDKKLFVQHDARWIDNGLPGAGNILIFNNGLGRPDGNYSTVDEIVPPIAADSSYFRNPNSAFGPSTAFWTYTAAQPTLFYSNYISGATRLPNGNTLICSGAKGKFFEVTSSVQIVWIYITPVTSNGILTQGQTPNNNSVFKIYRYPVDYSGFAGHDLTQSGPIEKYPTDVEQNEIEINGFELNQNYPNPFNPTTTIRFSLSQREHVVLKVFDMLGREVATLVNGELQAGEHSVVFNVQGLPSGVYFYRLRAAGFIQTKKMLISK